MHRYTPGTATVGTFKDGDCLPGGLKCPMTSCDVGLSAYPMSPSGNVRGEELHWPCKSASPDSVTKRVGQGEVAWLFWAWL